jgi:hypothetical protein
MSLRSPRAPSSPSIVRRAVLATALSVASAGALVLAPGLALAQPKPGEQPDPAKLEQAKKHMEAGVAFYNDPAGHKCEEAYSEFKKAYELSGSLNALKGMGNCALELERDGDAIDHFEKFLAGKGASLDANEKAQVESDLKALKAAVTWIVVNADRDGVSLLDVRTTSKGTQVFNRYTIGKAGSRIGIHPGQHTFTASADGVEVKWSSEITNGAAIEHTFDLAKAAPGGPGGGPQGPGGGGGEQKMVESRPIGAPVIVVGALSLGLAGAWVGLMVNSSDQKAQFDKKQGNASLADLQAAKSNLETANLLADIFMGATIVGVATTVVLIAVRPTVKTPAKTGSLRGPRAKGESARFFSSLDLVPSAGPTGGGALVVGRF